MSAKYQTLIEIKKVTDHDCGNYSVGEIDFGIMVGEVEDYLRRYGLDGRNSLIQTLGYLTHRVHMMSEDIHRQETVTMGKSNESV